MKQIPKDSTEKLSAHQVMRVIEECTTEKDLVKVIASGALKTALSRHDTDAVIRAFIGKLISVGGGHWSEVIGRGLKNV